MTKDDSSADFTVFFYFNEYLSVIVKYQSCNIRDSIKQWIFNKVTLYSLPS